MPTQPFKGNVVDHVNFNFTFDTLALVVIFNVVLTGLHYLLYWIYQKKKWVWSDRALNIVNFLMTMLAWFMANKAHPDTKPEVTPK